MNEQVIIGILVLLAVVAYVVNSKKRKEKRKETGGSKPSPTPKPQPGAGIEAHKTAWAKAGTAPSGFLWKAESESRQGRVAVLLPKQWNDTVITITAIVDGKIHSEQVGVMRDANGNPDREHNGNRLHFFGQYTGTKYKWPIVTVNGKAIQINQHGERTEF